MNALGQIPDKLVFAFIILKLYAIPDNKDEKIVPGDTVYPYFKNSPSKHGFAWLMRLM